MRLPRGAQAPRLGVRPPFARARALAVGDLDRATCPGKVTPARQVTDLSELESQTLVELLQLSKARSRIDHASGV